MKIGENAKIIVLLRNGLVKEYELWGNLGSYYSKKCNLGKDNLYYGGAREGQIVPHVFPDIAVEDIEYIKLSNLSLYNCTKTYDQTLIDGYEIELYKSALDNTI